MLVSLFDLLLVLLAISTWHFMEFWSFIMRLNDFISWKMLNPDWAYRLLNLWPPYLGAGVKTRIIDDGNAFETSMKLGVLNTNYVGVHFGGSLYSMCDPFFMLIMMKRLGDEYLVWDKWAKIEFKRPGKGKVRAYFEITDEQMQRVHRELEENGKSEPVFVTEIRNEQGKVVAVVQKGLWIVKKRATI